MYSHPASSSSIQFLLPSSHTISHNNKDCPPYSRTTWPGLAASQLQTPLYISGSEQRRDLSTGSRVVPDSLSALPVHSNALIDGLRTPPADDMSATYNSQPYRNYTQADVAYSSSKIQQAYSKTHTLGTSASNCDLRSHGSSQSHARPQSLGVAAIALDDSEKRKSLILPNLQIPSSINQSGGSLGEFAAQITCLFWFESVATLHRAEESLTALGPLVPDASPTMSFRKWVVTILSTTQVTPNVILLALLFIYRLKTLNPGVKGRAGSEYRLLTVALMLGNKFLDDNTYTNKTWAEVSGISVGEIHVMEVEFLSNMRYSLLASKEQWREWQTKLGKFATYCEQASNMPAPLPSPKVTSQPVLPSPPTSMKTSPPALSPYPPTAAAFNYNQWAASNSQPGNSHLPSMPELVPGLHLNHRKRSFDSAVEQPPAKRPARLIQPQIPVGTSAIISHSQIRQNAPRLPPPNLSIATCQPIGSQSSTTPIAPLLPLPSGRAMSTVYPATPGFQQSTPNTLTMSSAATQILNGSQYGTPSRRESPRSVQDLVSLHSPVSNNFSQHSQSSPSFFLQQRSSPYKPIRLPNTLLHPPPSTSVQGFQPASIDQMHYQPLGKKKDYRSGVVPDYVPHGTYPPWPALPQPNFYQ